MVGGGVWEGGRGAEAGGGDGGREEGWRVGVWEGGGGRGQWVGGCGGGGGGGGGGSWWEVMVPVKNGRVIKYGCDFP